MDQKRVVVIRIIAFLAEYMCVHADIALTGVTEHVVSESFVHNRNSLLSYNL